MQKAPRRRGLLQRSELLRFFLFLLTDADFGQRRFLVGPRLPVETTGGFFQKNFVVGALRDNGHEGSCIESIGAHDTEALNIRNCHNHSSIACATGK